MTDLERARNGVDLAFLHISPQVESALRKGGAVVALESTVIAQGLPRTLNLEIAHRLEKIVTTAGATPATIALLDGRPQVGLNDEQLRFIAESKDVLKISTRDLPIAFAKRSHGATTVASTLWIAYRAGIRVMATGGIGGVHRGELPDISADLPELARTPLVVVCSGAKIILDLPATREWLETHGITVVGFQCDEFPAFYSRNSGLAVDARIDRPAEVAEIFRAQHSLGIEKALLVTVPVPSEAEVSAELMQQVLDKVLEEALRLQIRGRELTPFLLSKMAATSEGATLRANIALLERNAQIAAEIANCL